MDKIKIKKISVLHLRAYEIYYIKLALEMYVEEHVYRADRTVFEILNKLNAFIADRPNVFDSKTEIKEDEEDSFYG